jgi:hypothetical protein
MDSSCFMMILSCDKYEDRRAKQNLSGHNFPYRYFIGKPNLDEPTEKGDIVYLNCPDNYESLIEKVQKGIEWIYKNHPDVKYILKTDDDVQYDFEKLKMFYDHLVKNNIDYAGLVVYMQPRKSNFHHGKCENSELDKVIYQLHKCAYCSGPAYFISRKSADIMIAQKQFETIYEDYEFGLLLNNNGIMPLNFNLQKFCCFWV